MRNSRWIRKDIKDKDGFRFERSDFDICRLVTPNYRTPWGYPYLPTNYFPPLLDRGDAVTGRLRTLFDLAYLGHADQPRNNFRDIIYQIDSKGLEEIRMAGFDMIPQHLQYIKHNRHLSHELMVCLIAASFEYGAKKHHLSIGLQAWPEKDPQPDWTPFILGDTLVLIEADMGTERIRIKEQATSIEDKYLKYLSLMKDGFFTSHFDVPKFVILFITLIEPRLKSMIEKPRGLKRVIDENDYDQDFAEHFAFANINKHDLFTNDYIEELHGYDRFMNKKPKLTDWAITQPYERAGFPVLQFLKGN
jgi:hypothetical protein